MIIQQKKSVASLFFIIVFAVLYGSYVYFTACHNSIFESKYSYDGAKPKILIIDMQKGFGGGQVATIAHFKALLAAGYPVHFLSYKDSYLDRELSDLKLSHYACKTLKATYKKHSYLLGFADNVRRICEQEKIDLIHCNNGYEVFGVRQAVQNLPVKIVLTSHLEGPYSPLIFKQVDGAIGVGISIAQNLSRLNETHSLGLSKISWIPPFWEYEKFRDAKFKGEPREVFLQRDYGIKLATPFVVINIAAFFKQKNQPFLLQGLKKMLECGKPFDLLFVGSGGEEQVVKRYAKDLGLEKYVHFLGFVKEVAPLIICSDVLALVSTQEALGIAILEGAICKKPLIGSAGTGMENIINHGRTGLLVQPGDVEGLAGALTFLYDNQKARTILGNAAYDAVQNNFSTSALLTKLEQFYDDILKKQINYQI